MAATTRPLLTTNYLCVVAAQLLFRALDFWLKAPVISVSGAVSDGRLMADAVFFPLLLVTFSIIEC